MGAVVFRLVDILLYPLRQLVRVHTLQSVGWNRVTAVEECSVAHMRSDHRSKQGPNDNHNIKIQASQTYPHQHIKRTTGRSPHMRLLLLWLAALNCITAQAIDYTHPRSAFNRSNDTYPCGVGLSLLYANDANITAESAYALCIYFYVRDIMSYIVIAVCIFLMCVFPKHRLVLLIAAVVAIGSSELSLIGLIIYICTPAHSWFESMQYSRLNENQW